MKDINHVKKLRKSEDWNVKHDGRTIKEKAESFMNSLKNKK